MRKTITSLAVLVGEDMQGDPRASKHITELLEGFSGYQQSDGYEAYETALKGNDTIVHVGCMAHARRKFDEAGKVSNKRIKRQ